MDELQKSWYELKFQLTFRSAEGNQFQDFFSTLMELRYPGDFQRIKPYGKLGDRKCDGYHSSIKVVYQLYAPETLKLAEMLGKIDEDFLGALDYWKSQMLGWRFVHNRWRGLPADVVSKLGDLESKHKIPVSHWGEPEIRNEAFLLPESDLPRLLGYAPGRRNVAEVGIDDLRIVVNTISQQEPVANAPIKPVPVNKLAANALSGAVSQLLLVGMQKSALVHKFFSNWYDPKLGDRVARAFRMRYEELRDNGVVGDSAFLELWRFAGGAERNSPRLEAAVLAVLAFLFEECEIFQGPKEQLS